MGWMGPVVNGQAHEGWVVPLFVDGAQGAGTTSARGVLIARRPDDGPRDGDQVRLAYRDGCTVEGIWQNRTVIGGDGIMPAEPGGQVHCEVIEEAEEWRPDTDVVGWPPASAGRIPFPPMTVWSCQMPSAVRPSR